MLFAGPMASAASLPDRDDVLRGQELQRQQAQRELTTAPAPVMRAAAGSARVPYPIEPPPCFAIDALAMDDDMPRPLRRELHSEWAPLRGRCLGGAGLAALATNLNARVHALGWLTSQIELPPQNLSASRLIVAWRPGRLTAVRELPGPVGLASLPLRPGDALTVAALDQAADAYNRLPSLRTQLLVVPSPGETGHGVEVQVQAGSPWRASLSLDNSSPREFGVAQLSAQIALDRPSSLLGGVPLLDQLALDLGINPQRHSPQRSNLSAGLNYTVALGFQLLHVFARSGQSAQRVQGTSIDFMQHGDDTAAGARWTWTWHRDAQSKWNLWLGAEQRRAHRAIEDVELVLQRRHTLSAELGGNLWLRSRIAERSLDWVIDISASRTQRRASLDAFEPEVTPKMRERRMSMATAVPFNATKVATNLAPDLAPVVTPVITPTTTSPATLDLRLSLHSVANPLAPSDLPLIGTRYAVRGFDGDAPLQGKQAAVLRTDVRWPSRAIGQGVLDIAPYLGLDVGMVRGLAAASPGGRSLSGATPKATSASAAPTVASPLMASASPPLAAWASRARASKCWRARTWSANSASAAAPPPSPAHRI